MEKLALIGQAKEAEERRNQDMRRFADDRERHARQQAEVVKSSVCFQRQYQTSILVKERMTLVMSIRSLWLHVLLLVMKRWKDGEKRETHLSLLWKFS